MAPSAKTYQTSDRFAEHIKIGAVVRRGKYGKPDFPEILFKLRQDGPVCLRDNAGIVAECAAAKSTKHKAVRVIGRRHRQDFAGAL